MAITQEWSIIDSQQLSITVDDASIENALIGFTKEYIDLMDKLLHLAGNCEAPADGAGT